MLDVSSNSNSLCHLGHTNQQFRQTNQQQNRCWFVGLKTTNQQQVCGLETTNQQQISVGLWCLKTTNQQQISVGLWA